MPDEGTTAWDDVVLGRIEVANKELEDVVIVRADGRPTYNFASPVEDTLRVRPRNVSHARSASDRLPRRARSAEKRVGARNNFVAASDTASSANPTQYAR